MPIFRYALISESLMCIHSCEGIISKTRWVWEVNTPPWLIALTSGKDPGGPVNRTFSFTKNNYVSF